MKSEYRVKLDSFEGPIDLLLYCIQNAEMDIKDIRVSEISRQYLEYLDLMRELNINLASEYLSMAATLVRLKSREMLPQQEAEALDEEEGIVSREQLIEKLLEYKKFKEAAQSLRTYESEQYGSFSRGKAEETEMHQHQERDTLPSASIFDLISAFQKILEGADQNGAASRVIEKEEVKLDDRIEHILGMLDSDTEVPFEDLFRDDVRRIAMIVTFMALLELVRMERVRFRQETMFGVIFIMKRLDFPAQQKGPA